MKRLMTVLLSSALLFGVAACESAKTSADAPNDVENAADAPTVEQAQENKEDATSEIRRDQLNADIQAREERNNITGGDQVRAEGDLQSEVRSKLEANLPASTLAVEAEDSTVTVSGTVPTEEQLKRIEPLAMEIKGVKAVNVKVTVVKAQPQTN
ncbi:BON domain-containing protein [Lyngbya aestuarii]|uniref:BON domain-containing protein n=1 Tax=Lyngbya aestuarii TaxID=118322 RepID=UPI00403D6641